MYLTRSRRSVMKYVFTVILIVTLAVGYGLQTAKAQNAADTKVFKTADYQVRVVTLAQGLAYPYSFTFLPDGSMLIAQLNGQVRMFRNAALAAETVSGVP